MAASSVEGPLSKWTNVMKGWQYRWFVLDDNAGLLSYYTNMARGARRGCVRLQGAVIGIDDEDDSTFTIRVDRKIFHFQARDAEERERWVRALEDTILRHTLQRQPNARLWDQTGIVAPTQQNFDTKLTEADSYLQLLIEQIRDLEFNIEKVTDVREKQQLSGIGNNANNTAQPVNGVYSQRRGDERPLPLRREEDKLAGASEGRQVGRTGRSAFHENPLEESHALVTPAVSVIHPASGGLIRAKQASKSRQDKTPGTTDAGSPEFKGEFCQRLPPVSYSSSDDEDFFDAREERDTLPTQTPEAESQMQETGKPAASKTDGTTSPGGNAYSLYDAAYDEETEDESLASLEGQKSVFSHLLSQVRIGMDLTKVTLPTFILERRSLLEMYADFFAHPDLFVSIVDHQDPRDRMVEVVRWYLSAFHAGRKTSVAKKPYNPILGEIFRCYWRIGDKPGVPVPDGPVPWATSNDLSFIAEQLLRALACCDGVTATFSALCSIVDHQDPRDRMVEVVRWYLSAFHAGRKTSVAKKPYNPILGEIFRCYWRIGDKPGPIIGGRRHQLTAEIFPPNDRRPFLTVTGEWNGVMTVKKPSGDLAVFVDTTSLPITKKVVKPIEKQEPYESRRMWKEVTLALKNKDVNLATEGKSLLEEKQRSEARERKENNVTWQNRVFHEVGEHWVYNNSLQKRLGKKS
ncbi:oxysterol binding protein 9, putative [Ixodes scapularis]|uniref:Oxysterol binding protein 9, putative n=1 Tax=Ixodes scapularis TaxID=6945 RepID=B7PFK0_IXOSC|nr:oxysterol binding protein 9, putative [Ixodes scapularis]|eukprot:XP_002433972.1 oxysterol binding protein 9, putative [Ixodes scapularis]